MEGLLRVNRAGEDQELRSIRSSLQVSKLGGKTYIEGYAIRFNEPSVLLSEGGKQFKEVIKPEAVDKALVDSSADIILNYNHDDNKMLARFNPSRGVRTLELRKTDQGVFISAEAPDTAVGKEVVEHIRHGNLFGMSFVFYITKSDEIWSRSSDGTLIRTITNIRKISDVSVVRKPAYPTTSIQTNSRAIEALRSITESSDQTRILARVAEFKRETPNYYPVQKSINNNLKINNMKNQRSMNNQNFSIAKAIQSLAKSGSLEGVEAEVNQRNCELLGMSVNPLSIMVSTREEGGPDPIVTGYFDSTKGVNLTQTNKHIGLGISAVPTIFDQLGVTVMKDLTGNVDIHYSAAHNNSDKPGEKGETSSTGFNAPGKKTLSLKRYSWADVVTVENLMGMSEQLFALILADATKSNMRKIEADLLLAAGAITPVSGFEGGEDADAALDFGDLVDIENTIHDIANCKYVSNKTIWKGMRKKLVETGSSQRLVGGKIEDSRTATGLPMVLSGYQPAADAKKLILGNWSEAFVGFWGDNMAEIIIDPYYNTKQGLAEITINHLADVAIRDVSQFAVASNVVM